MKDSLLAQLDLVEQQFSQVAAFLASGDALALQSASATLQNLSVEMARLMQTQQAMPAMQKAMRQRVHSMGAGLQMLRDNLSRRAAYNEQALSVVIPTPAKSTYSGGTSVYGSVAKQSGTFKFLAA